MTKRKTKRKLSDIDFTHEGAHIALVSSDVSGPANGYNKALVMKSLKNFSAEGIEKMKEIKVKYKLPDFLQKVMNMYREDAFTLASMMGYEDDEDEKEASVDVYKDYIESRLASFEIMKAAYDSEDLPSMISTLDEDDYLDLLEDQQRIEKCFEKVEKDATEARPESSVGVEKGEGKKKYKEKAESVKSGQFVSWNSSGGKAYGKVTRVATSGSIKVPGSSFTINAESDDPAVLIRLYRKGSEGWMPTDTLVGHKASTLTKIKALRKARNSTQTTEVNMANENQNEQAEITVDVVEKSQFEAVEKANEALKSELEEVRKAVAAFEAEKKEMIRKARKSALDEVVLNSDQAETLFKAFGEVESEELYGEVIGVLKAMQEAVDDSELMQETGVSEEAEVEESQSSLVADFLKKQYNKD